MSTLFGDSQDNLWIAAGTKGLLEYIPKTDSFLAIPSASKVSNGLHFNSTIHCIYEDKEGNIWIGTDEGISIFNPSHQRFHFFDNDPLNPNSKTKMETMDFLQTKSGELWVATWGSGLTLFDNHLMAKEHFVFKKPDNRSVPESHNLAWAMIRYQSDTMIVGYQGGLLSIIDTRNNHFYNVAPKGLDHHTIINLNMDKENTLWLALNSGMAFWKIHDPQAFYYKNFIPYHGVSRATAADILPDNAGHIWVGTMGLGLQQFDVKQNRFTRIYTPEEHGLHPISSALVNCLIAINDTLMAIGTGSGGINIFNKVTGDFSSINTADGLPSNNVSALYFIPPFTLWATTGNTISEINISTKHINRFGPQDGIKDLDFSGCHRMYMLKDGKLLSGYTGGFLYFNPGNIKADRSPTNVSLTGIKINDHPLPVDSVLNKSDTITLSYSQNFITFQFASLSYLEANRINYFYKLEGLDKSWINGNLDRQAVYTDLKPGHYLFEVKSQNSDGTPSKEITRLVLNINPPFWQRWWFFVLVFSAVVFSLYLAYRYRVNQILQLQKIRNEISKDLHDDVGSTLSSISILSQVARDKMAEGQREQSSSIMSRINFSSQEMVEKMGDIVWAVNSRKDTIQDIIQRLKNAFSEACTSREIQLLFLCDSILEKRTIPMPIRKNLYLLCKEAINNAIKYSGGHCIKVEFSVSSKWMELQISDDGKGFDLLQTPQGNGLQNIRTRAQEMKGSVAFQSSPKGTQVVLRLNIPKSR